MLNVDDLRRNGTSDAGPSPADRVAEEILYQRVQAWLKDRFREAELLEPGAHVDSAVREAIGKVMQAYRREAAIAGTPGLDDPAGVEQRLADRVLGFGYLAPLLADPDNEEIQAIGGRVRIYRHGRWELVEHLAPDDAETLRLVRRLLAPGDRIDESSPEVESTLPDGSRLTAVIPPETEQVTLTIRRYVVRHHRLADLGTLPSEAVALVEAYARGGASIITAGPGGAGKCVTGETPVTLANGELKPISALFDPAVAVEHASGADTWMSAPVPASVLTFDFSRGEMTCATSVTAWRHTAPAALIEVVTRSGQVLRVTPEHPFFMLSDGEAIPVRADALAIGDRVAAANRIVAAGQLPDLFDLLANNPKLRLAGVGSLLERAHEIVREQEGLLTRRAARASLGKLPDGTTPWTWARTLSISNVQALLRRIGLTSAVLPDLLPLRAKASALIVRVPRRPTPAHCRLAGLVAGDGHLGVNSVELTSGTEEVRASVTTLIDELFGLKVRIRRAPTGKCPTLVVSSQAAAEVLSAAFAIPPGRKARVVRAPGWLHAAPESHIAAYLSGLLDRDGSIVPPSSDRAGVVQFCTTSPRLADDIVALLLRLGVRSHLCRRAHAFQVNVYDTMCIARLRRLVTLAHPRRVRALEQFAESGQSGVDVIPGFGLTVGRLRAGGMSFKATASMLGISEATLYDYQTDYQHPRRDRVLDFSRRVTDRGISERLAVVAAQPIFWDRVAAVRLLVDHGERYVYDLTVPSTHTFFMGAGGVVGHNTTLLRCIVAAGDPSRTICSIEDVRELALHQYHPAAIPLYAHRANIEGAGARTYRELMRTALRLRPDVLVVGECRGAEALDWLLAAATGHQCLGTLHSDSPRGALRQLGTFAQLATEGINAHAIGEMIAEHFDLVIVCGFGPDGARRVTHIFEVTGLGKDGVIDGSDLWVLDPEAGHLVPTGVRPRRLERLRAHGSHNGLPGRLLGFGAALLLAGGTLFLSGVRL